jgi:hypothetical protein
VRRAAAIAWLAALAACPQPEPAESVELLRLTSAPPASRAAIVNRDAAGNEVFEIELSHGVAFAARCWDTCEPDPACTLAALYAEDPEILGIGPVYRAGAGGSEYVLIGREVGMTTLHIRASCTSRTYEVTVLPPAR